MTRHTTTRAALAAAAVLLGVHFAGCASENGSVFVEGILPIDIDQDCVVDPNGGVFVSGAVLDVGTGGDNANALVVAARVVTNLPNTFAAQDDTQSETRSPNYPNYGNSDSNVITFTESRVRLALDNADAVPLPEGVKTEGDTPAVSGVGGTVYNTQTQLNTGAAVVATVITQTDAAALQSWVAAQTGLRGRIIADIQIAGTTTGGGSVLTPPFHFPIELCQGCLVDEEATCANGLEDQGCFRGVNERSVCRP